MWPAFAKAAGIAPDSVNFVNVGPTAKIAALKSHAVDIISDFYNEHDLKVIEFGSDLGYLNWKDIGLNPYGNSLIVNGAFLEKNPKLVEVSCGSAQKAYAACVADVAPCLKALLDKVSGLDKENQQRQWERIKYLMTDEFTTTKALGWIDGERMKKDYELVQTYLGMEKPFDVRDARSPPGCWIHRSRWMRARSRSDGRKGVAASTVIARSVSDEAIHASLRGYGLLRFARNDEVCYCSASHGGAAAVVDGKLALSRRASRVTISLVSQGRTIMSQPPSANCPRKARRKPRPR